MLLNIEVQKLFDKKISVVKDFPGAALIDLKKVLDDTEQAF